MESAASKNARVFRSKQEIARLLKEHAQSGLSVKALVLLITEGKGYYQEKGQPKRVIQKGDIIKCPPGVTHWHRAAPGTKLTHIAIAPDAEKGNAVWLQKVTDEEYNSPK